MDITIHASFLPHDDPDASLGSEVRDLGYGGMRWITVSPADQPGTSIVLYPPAATPGITDEERHRRPNDPPAAGQAHSSRSFIAWVVVEGPLGGRSQREGRSQRRRDDDNTRTSPTGSNQRGEMP
jgi:hypothetical protein